MQAEEVEAAPRAGGEPGAVGYRHTAINSGPADHLGFKGHLMHANMCW